MPVCRYFQQGTCRFGNNCKFDHFTPQGRNCDNYGYDELLQGSLYGGGGGEKGGRGGYSQSNYDDYDDYRSYQRPQQQQSHHHYVQNNRYSKNYTQQNKQDYTRDYRYQDQYRQHHQAEHNDAYEDQSSNYQSRYTRDYTQQGRSRQAQSSSSRYNQDNRNDHQNQYNSPTRSHAVVNQFPTASSSSSSHYGRSTQQPASVDFSFNSALKGASRSPSQSAANVGFSFNQLHNEIKQKEFSGRRPSEDQMDQELQNNVNASSFSFNQALARANPTWNQPKNLFGGTTAVNSFSISASRVATPTTNLYSASNPPLGRDTSSTTAAGASSQQKNADRGTYSDSLTEEQLQLYQASEFKFRQIPLQAPTKQLCC